ncbi:MAG: hypothetical protein D6820_18345 [Lentisphaerae bacterium]|nr:MAG: hypothetical protein D6820_18345 [Lentisphaerota bacterium]
MAVAPLIPGTTDQVRQDRILLIWIGVGALVTLLRIDLIPWINDEPRLILRALQANAAGHPAPDGLPGSLGIRYFPVIIWFYQLLLKCSYDILTIAFCKILFCYTLFSAAIFSLRRFLRCRAIFLALLFVSPPLWFTHRILWDNCFLVPLVPWVILAAAWFVTRPGWGRLLAWLIPAVLAIYIHPQVLFLQLPSLVVMVLYRKRWFFASLRRFWAVSGLGTLLLLPFLVRLLNSHFTRGSSHRHAAPWFAGLTGWRMFCSRDFAAMLPDFPRVVVPDFPWLRWFVQPLHWLSIYFAAGLFGLGVIWLIREGVRLHRRRQLGCRQAFPVQFHRGTIMLWIAGGTVVLQSLFFMVTHVHDFSHYFNGTWIAYYLIMLSGFAMLSERLWMGACSVYTAVTTCLLFAVMLRIACCGGAVSFQYGPVLGDQLRIARQVARYRTGNYRWNGQTPASFNFSHALDTLVKLEWLRRQTPPTAQTPPLIFTVTFRTPRTPWDAWQTLSVQSAVNTNKDRSAPNRP